MLTYQTYMYYLSTVSLKRDGWGVGGGGYRSEAIQSNLTINKLLRQNCLGKFFYDFGLNKEKWNWVGFEKTTSGLLCQLSYLALHVGVSL